MKRPVPSFAPAAPMPAIGTGILVRAGIFAGAF